MIPAAQKKTIGFSSEGVKNLIEQIIEEIAIQTHQSGSGIIENNLLETLLPIDNMARDKLIRKYNGGKHISYNSILEDVILSYEDALLNVLENEVEDINREYVYLPRPEILFRYLRINNLYEPIKRPDDIIAYTCCCSAKSDLVEVMRQTLKDLCFKKDDKDPTDKLWGEELFPGKVRLIDTAIRAMLSAHIYYGISESPKHLFKFGLAHTIDDIEMMLHCDINKGLNAADIHPANIIAVLQEYWDLFCEYPQTYEYLRWLIAAAEPIYCDKQHHGLSFLTLLRELPSTKFFSVKERYTLEDYLDLIK